MNIQLLRWFALICALIAGTIIGVRAGGARFLWTADATHITVGMVLLFIIISIFIGRLTAARYRVAAAEPGGRLHKFIDACWFTAELEMGLGILVTVSGFLIAFANGFAHLNLNDADAARQLVSQMATGLSTALVGTLIGIATSMLIKLQLVNLETDLRNQNFLLSYIDLLMNLSISFAAIFLLSMLLINKPVKAVHAVEERAKILIVMTWDGHSADDMDLWIKTPDGNRVGYSNPNGSIAHLQRDDMGPINDFVDLPNGERKYARFNQEISSIRTKAAGHYTVNVEFYRRHPDPETKLESDKPVDCTVELIQIDPSYKELQVRKVTLDDQGAEETAFSFDVNNDQVENISFAREPFVL